jgi:hypothetical protein
MIALFALPLLLSVSPMAADRLFVSPMGEPFVGDKTNPPALTWYTNADADKDGRLSIYEFQDDAQRFFKTLDTDKSGEIDPQENERYELLIQQAISDSNGGLSKGLFTSNAPPEPLDDGPRSTVYVRRGGASRYNWLGIPQPVMSADTNFNRGVTAAEFDRAAVTRFRLLDRDGDMILDKAELPKN